MAVGWDDAAVAAGTLLQGIGGLGANAQNAASTSMQIAHQNLWRTTAHQVEVDDLRKAGLNPMLSALNGAGAAVPAGSQSQATNPFQGMAAAAKEAMMMRAQIDKLEQETDTSAASERNMNEDTRFKKAMADVVDPVGQGMNAIKGGVKEITGTAVDAIEKFNAGNRQSAQMAEEKQKVEEARKRYNERAKEENAKNKLFGNKKKFIPLKEEQPVIPLTNP